MLTGDESGDFCQQGVDLAAKDGYILAGEVHAHRAGNERHDRIAYPRRAERVCGPAQHEGRDSYAGGRLLDLADLVVAHCWVRTLCEPRTRADLPRMVKPLAKTRLVSATRAPKRDRVSLTLELGAHEAAIDSNRRRVDEHGRGHVVRV